MNCRAPTTEELQVLGMVKYVRDPLDDLMDSEISAEEIYKLTGQKIDHEKLEKHRRPLHQEKQCLMMADLSKYTNRDSSTDAVYNFGTIYGLLDEVTEGGGLFNSEVHLADDGNNFEDTFRSCFKTINIIEKILDIYHIDTSQKIVLKCQSNDIYDALYFTCYVFLYRIYIWFDEYSSLSISDHLYELNKDSEIIIRNKKNGTIDGNLDIINYYRKQFDEIINQCYQQLGFIKPYHDWVRTLIEIHFEKPTFEILLTDNPWKKLC
jgi:hypothetical protein